jgi:RNA polymerase primary sigma factor
LAAALNDAVGQAGAGGRLSFAAIRGIADRHRLPRSDLAAFLSLLLSRGIRPEAAETKALAGDRPVNLAAARDRFTPRLAEPPAIRRRGVSGQLGPVLERLHDHRLLSPAEEQELGRAIDRGRLARTMLAEHPDLEGGTRQRAEQILRAAERAEETLLLSNIRLVGSIARRYASTLDGRLKHDDLLTEGVLGLVRAIQLWDHSRGLRFSTYGLWWIRQSIQRAVDNQSTTVRLPIHAREALRRLRRAARALERDGVLVTVEALVAATGSAPGLVEALLPHLHGTVSLDAPLGEGGATLGQLLVDPSVIDPAELAEQVVLALDVESALDALTDRQRFVIERRFGLGDTPTMTLEEIGQLLGVTRERIRQIEHRAKGRLVWQLSKLGYGPPPKRDRGARDARDDYDNRDETSAGSGEQETRSARS